MDRLTPFLTMPGELLTDLFFSSSFAEGTEERATLAVTLGIVFWIVALLALRLAWHLFGVRLEGSALRAAQVIEAKTRTTARSIATGWTWLEVWGAVWRAQVVHIALVAMLPLLWVALSFTWFGITLPFRVISFHDDNRGWYDGTLDHLRQPACWTFATSCPGPRVDEYRGALDVDLPNCPAGARCLPERPRPPEGSGWRWKLWWAGLTLAWIALWRTALRHDSKEK